MKAMHRCEMTAMERVKGVRHRLFPMYAACVALARADRSLGRVTAFQGAGFVLGAAPLYLAWWRC
jgi:hypothetical protein